MLTWLYRAADRLRHRARQKRWAAGLATGRLGEDLAHRFLQKSGYRVVARNYRPPSGAGEIDLVAWDGEVLVFIEVKTRASDEFGSPDRAVGRQKESHVERAARDFARRAGVPAEAIRFDIVNVVLGRPHRVQLLRDAFRLRQTI